MLVVAPLAIAGGVLWLASRPLAPALTLGPALYAVYTYTTVIVGQEYTRYAGNVEHFFPLYAGLVALGAALAAVACPALAAARVAMPGDRLRRTLAVIFLVIGLFFALAWISQIRSALGRRPPVEYVESPTLFWTIKLLDLAFVIPLLIATGIGMWRKAPWAMVAASGLATFTTCLVLSVAAMAVAMARSDDPSAEPVVLAVAASAGLLALLTVLLLRSPSGRGLRRRREGTGPSQRQC